MDLEQINFGYSLKNKPIPSTKYYMKCFIDKLDSFKHQLRWKAHFFDSQPDDDYNQNENFGFKSELCPPQHEGLNAFEADLYELARSIQFKKVHNSFLSKLSQDVKCIAGCTSLLVPADKTTNLYKVGITDNKKLLHDNVTANYQITDANNVKQINLDAENIAKTLKLNYRIKILAKKETFLTIKDHKPNFYNNPKCHLINPTKSEIGIISKKMLDQINSSIRSSTGLMQWRNSSAVISWFRKIPCKDMCKFLKFDIVDFYPSITENLLAKSLEFAQNYVEVDEHTANIIMHCRQSILFSNSSAWSKKRSPQFDIAMGSFDGAEVCELVGLYMLYHLSSVTGDKMNIGLYRDDGLAILEATSGLETDRIQKKTEKLFKDHNLHITTKIGLIQTDFLDVTFNLKSGKYWSCCKPNEQPLYINAGSNHPPMIKKQLPSMLSKRLSELSCNREELEKAATPYNIVIKTSGYHRGLTNDDHATDTHARRRNRKHNIVSFNPPLAKVSRTTSTKNF